MDLITLALSKNYTDKRIEKAQIGEMELDTTLTKQGFAADAKAVGEAITNVVDNIPEQVQVDWDQSDASASDYIKNKPFYETKSNIQKICTEKEGTVNTQFSNGWYGTSWNISDFENLQWPNNGQICSVTINGEKYEAILIGGVPYLDGTDNNNFYLRFNGEGRGSIAIYYATAILDETCTVSIEIYDKEIKQLDEKFIPNSIVRSNEIVQSDWDQYDSTFMNYVKNRTHYRDYQWQHLKLPWYTDASAVPGFAKLPIETLNESALYDMLKYNNLLDQYYITAVQALGNGIPIQGYIISDINTGDVVLSSVLSLEHNYIWSMFIGENRAFTPTELGSYVYCTVRAGMDYITSQEFYCYESPILSWAFPNWIYHTLDSQYLPEIPTEKIPHAIARTSDIPSVDTTLSVEGAAADAKAVGDAIAAGSSGMHVGPDKPTNPNVSVWFDTDETDVADYIPAPSTAQVGQTIVVKEVDEYGRPTAWECADLAGGDKWELINSYTTTEDMVDIEIATDLNGEPFSLKDIGIKIVKNVAGSEMLIEAYDERSVMYRLAYFPNSNRQSQYYRKFYSDTFVISRWGTASDATSENAGLGFTNSVARVANKILLSGYEQAVFVAGTTVELWGVRT